MIYPAITLWQPWASLVAEEAKPLEFRSWPAPPGYVGKRVAVHAGARPLRRVEVQDLLLRLQGDDWRTTGLIREKAIPLLESTLVAPALMPRSCVVCLATLGQPVRDDEVYKTLGIINDSDRDEHSNWGWPLSAIERLAPPVPASGSQGWWRWTAP